MQASHILDPLASCNLTLKMAFDLDISLTSWRFPFHINQVWFQADFQQMRQIFTFSVYLTTWPQITSDLNMWHLTSWTYEDFHITSINQVKFQLDFNFSNEAKFTFSGYFTTWPQMTFDLGMWPLTSSTNESSHVIIYNPSLVEIHQSSNWTV